MPYIATTVYLLEISAHRIDIVATYVCGAWSGTGADAYIASDKHPAPEKGLATRDYRFFVHMILRMVCEFLVTYVHVHMVTTRKWKIKNGTCQ